MERRVLDVVLQAAPRIKVLATSREALGIPGEVHWAVDPLPVNVLAFDYGWTTAHLADLGVRRVSLGGALARKAYTEAMNAAKAWLDTGSLTDIGATMPIPFPKVFG